MNRQQLLAVLAAVALSTGCATQTAATPPPSTSPTETTPPPAGTPTPTPMGATTATAQLESRSGSAVTGTAQFTQGTDGNVQVVIQVSGATPGQHGLHLHEKGDCSAPDASSAGPHWNPTAASHGAPSDASHHAGDLGNIEVGADGKGTTTMTHGDWSIGPVEGKQDIVGKAVVFHASADDLKSQPAGNSGARQACGVIQVAK